MAEPRIFTSAEELRAAVGEQLGPQRLAGDRPEADRPVRRGDRRPPVDPCRPREGRGGPLRHDHRARLSHAVAAAALRPAAHAGRGRDDGRQLRHEQGPLPRPRPGRLPAARHAPLAEVDGGGGGVQVTALGHRRARGRRQAGLRGGVGVPLLPLSRRPRRRVRRRPTRVRDHAQHEVGVERRRPRRASGAPAR